MVRKRLWIKMKEEGSVKKKWGKRECERERERERERGRERENEPEVE